MKVRHGEGVANHIGPEPCVAVRKDVDEASVATIRFGGLSEFLWLGGLDRLRVCLFRGRPRVKGKPQAVASPPLTRGRPRKVAQQAIKAALCQPAA